MADDPTAHAPIVLDYDPSWQQRGLALAGELRSDLGPLPLHVEHIGSTAIPGMAAKPVFDLQITVADLHEAERAFDRLLADRGFRLSRYRHDHVPAGLDDDRERWTKRLWSRRGQAGADCNLHVRLLGSPNDRLALLFRDWFRAHPEAVPAYARFKSVLAGAVRDVDTYSDVKDPVVDLVVGVAETWAAATGWTPHPSGEVRAG
ncbi:GrpB family protein [Kitasatospora sp. MAA4]|uniref:GrpB family protein n=1 Tax=Kitasatospora sp. MAA4 TaxID=3035093 RepID=UPI002473DA57|nr:GrpB family protein [Kitasatospora sp. MAA4]